MSSIGGKPSPARLTRKHGRWRMNNTFRLETMFPSRDEVVITLPLMSPVQTTTRFVTSTTGASTPTSSSSALSASSTRLMSTLASPSLEASSPNSSSVSSSASTSSATSSTSRSSMASSTPQTLKRSLSASDGPSPIPSTASAPLPTTSLSSTSSSPSASASSPASISSTLHSTTSRSMSSFISSLPFSSSTSSPSHLLTRTSWRIFSASSSASPGSSSFTTPISSSSSLSIIIPLSTTPLSTNDIPSHTSSSTHTSHTSSSTRTSHKSSSTRSSHSSSFTRTSHKSSSTRTSHKSSSTRTSLSPTTTQHIYTSTLHTTSNRSGSATTVSTVLSSGSPSTGVSTSDNNRFAYNPGAIIGTAFGAAIAAAVVGVWIYVALRWNKQRRISELNASLENVTVMPEDGWRPPFEDGDDEDIPPANYAGLLASLGELGEDQPYDSAQPSPGSGEGSEEGMSSDYAAYSSEHGHGGGRAPSLYSHHSSSRHHPYMTGFGQAAETMRDDQPMMAMADGALPVSATVTATALATASTTPEDAEQDHGSWLVSRELGYQPRSGPSPFGGQSSSQGQLSLQGHSSPERYAKRKESSDEDPFATYPMQSSSQTQASSSSDIGSSSGHRRSVDAKRQNSVPPVPPVPPTNFRYSKRNGSERSMKGILGRLRGRASTTPVVADVILHERQASLPTTRPKSVRNRSAHRKSRSISPPFMFGPPIIDVRAPTPRPTSPPSQPPSPVISRQPSRPTISNYTPPAGIAWPGQEVLEAPGISPSTSLGNSRAEGLLDPMLLWRLTQARVDSSTSLRDNEDYTRPFGQLTVHNRQHSLTTVDTDDDEKNMIDT